MRVSCLTVSFPVSLRCGLAKRSVGSTGVQLTSPPVNVSAQFPPQHAFLWLWFTHSLVASSTCALQGTARQSCLTVAPHWTDWTLHINPRCGEDCGCAFFHTVDGAAGFLQTNFTHDTQHILFKGWLHYPGWTPCRYRMFITSSMI